MNINEKFFSFPPYLSTSWNQVSALSLNKLGQITFHMSSGDLIVLPLLSEEETDQIFKAHAQYLENQVLIEPVFKHPRFLPNPKERFEGNEIRFAFGTLEGLSSAMQHNPAQKNAPNLPKEMLVKISEVSKILAPTDPDQLPRAEPHCNCYHCQIARALSGAYAQDSDSFSGVEEKEEEVELEELEFQQWEITQTGEKLFNVSNKLDQLESYSVHLGHPVGCTCGKQDCEHILAVLKS